MFPFPFSFVAPTSTGIGTVDNVYSMEFDGVNDYFAATYSGNVYACSIWFKPDSTITTATLLQYLISFGGTFNGVLLGSSTSSLTNELIVVADSAAVGRSAYTASGGTISNTWHHLCFNWSGSVYEIWLDGVNVQNTTTGTPTLISASQIQIGRRSTGASYYYFEGKIDEVALFNYTLDADQIQEIYNATSTGVTADLDTLSTPPVAWYRMGD